jgi:hypothetical protein
MIPGKRLSLSVDVHATVFQAEIFVILACPKECIGRAYTGEHMCAYLDNHTASCALEASMVMSRFVWECRQVLCTLPCWNKVTLLWVPGHCEIQGNEDADALAREGSSSPFLSLEPAISVHLVLAGSRLRSG